MKSTLLLLFSLSIASVGFAQKQDTIKTKKVEEVVVSAARPYSAASDAEFRALDFQLRPRNSAQDMLRVVPGLFIAQHAGGGKAEQIFLRGFDCDHGTDINITVDDAPVNMVSHGHGQGYADLHFIIPETIERVDVAKGPYFARYGDLTTAGAVVFNTFDVLKESIVKIETGTAAYLPGIKNRAFTTFRGLGLFNLTNPSDKFNAYIGADVYKTDGYFELPQNFQRMNLIAKATGAVGEDGSLSASVLSMASGWDANGQIPDRTVQSGLISRFGSIDSTEGGSTSRTTGIVKYSTGGTSPFTLTASMTGYKFRLFSNFTLYARDSVRGDGIEQVDDRSILSLRGEKNHVWFAGDVVMKTRVGVSLRSDDIQTSLFYDSARTRHETIIDAAITQHQIGPYVEQEIVLPWIQIQGGVRIDYFNFDVANHKETLNNPSGIVQALLVSPKLNIAVPLGDRVTFFGNSGFGFHSNDARAVVSGKNQNSLPGAFGLEFGARVGKTTDILSGSAALWQLDLESEFVWVGDEGTTESSGRTRRQGIDLECRFTPIEWLSLSADMTISQGRLRDEPEGMNFIPLAPNMTLTGNLLTRFDDLSAAVRLRMIDDRAANEDNSVQALGYSVVDLSASYRFEHIELFANIENVFNIEWNEAQFDTGSRLRGELSDTPSEIHFTAGTPRSIRAGISYRF